MTNEKTAPQGNTGAVVTHTAPSIGIGWLTFTLSTKKFGRKRVLLDALLYCYTNHFLDNVCQTEVKARTYTDGYRTIAGSLILFSPNRDDVCLSISQTAIEKLSLTDFLTFCWDILSCEPEVSRIDLYIDEFDGYASPERLLRAVNLGWYVGRAGRVGAISQAGSKDIIPLSFTLTFGSRSSETFVRVYDKALETGTLGCWNRIEMECKGDFAKRVFRLLLESADLIYDVDLRKYSYNESALVNTLKGLILNKIDFRYSDSAKNISRRERCEFWEKIFMDIEAISTFQPKSQTDIDRLEEWFSAAVAPSLSLLLDYHGEAAEEWLRKMVVEGRARRRARHTEILLKSGAK